MSDIMQPESPLSQEELYAVALALADGHFVSFRFLDIPDCRALLALVAAIIRWRKDRAMSLPKPQAERPLAAGTVDSFFKRLQLNPASIASDILAEPLMQAIMSILARALSMSLRAALKNPTPSSGLGSEKSYRGPK